MKPAGVSANLDFKGETCHGCGESFPRQALDDNRCCDGCRPRMQRRLRVGRHAIAAGVVVPFGIWILRLDRGQFLPDVAWLLPLAAAYYLGFRIGGELVKGYARWLGSR